MAESRLAVVILAAGQGKRMHSSKPKVLHAVLGEPMLLHVLRAAAALEPWRMVVVTGHGRETVEAYVTASTDPAAVGVTCIEQRNPNGTGHAVLCAQPAWDGADEVLILYGDVPLLRVKTLQGLLAAREGGFLSLLVSEQADPTGYGRAVLQPGGGIERVVEHKDATEAERRITLVNAGMMAVQASFLKVALSELRPDNAQGELYLTDLVGMARKSGAAGQAYIADDAAEMLGVNNRVECAQATQVLRKRLNREHMLAGVALEDPNHAWIEAGVQLEADCTIGPDVELRGRTRVSAGALIERGCVVTDCEVGPGAHLLPYTVATASRIGPGAHVGPFAHLRPGTVLDDKVKVGNFVETKKAHFKKGAKASHLSYIGDAEIGAGSNIGAGTITCNYDGVNKHRTVLGEGVFIGSDTQLVAPVTLGDGAYVGAGTTVTQDVPAGALAVSRTKQANIEGWVARKNARQAAAKQQATANGSGEPSGVAPAP